ncbi:Xylosylprotein beta 1,4-galactosyltransferase, polypeptide 7 [Chamberlinius hualienensis]
MIIKEVKSRVESEHSEMWGSRTLCVIVPFRDRFEELLEFAPRIHKFLNKQRIRHHLLVINQVDQHRFNRASLINVGFIESKDMCDYIAMHDVDLIPLNDELSYAFPEFGPHHLAAPHLHPRYHYKTFVGGILLLRKEHFEMVNGLSNRYWGWGLEDDEFFLRIKGADLNISRPGTLSTGINDTFLHLHDRNKRKRDTAKLFNQKEVTRRRDRITGLKTVKYNLLKKYKIVIEEAPVIVFNVELICHRKETPWCDSVSQQSKSKVNKSKVNT